MTVIVGALLFSYALVTRKLPASSPFNRLPYVYTPTADVLLSPDKTQNGSLAALLGQSGLSSLSGLLSSASGNTNADLAVRLLKGPTICDEIAQELDFVGHYHLTKNPVTTWRAIMKQRIKSQFEASSSVLTLSYTDTDKIFATAVLNALLPALEQRFNALTSQRLDDSQGLLRQQLADTEADFHKAQNALVEFSRAHGIVDINAQRTSSVDTNAAFRQELATKELRLAEVSTYRSPDDPEVKQLHNEVTVLRQYIAESTAGFQQFSPTSIPESQIPGLAADYLNLQYDLQLKQGIYMSTRQSWETLLLQQKGSVPVFQILERAQVPEIPSGPSRSHIVMVGTLVAFVVAVLLAFVLEYFGRAAQDPVEGMKLRSIRAMVRRRGRGADTRPVRPPLTG